ncbi:hypothetical protein [Thermosynechococcus sp. M3746_W2019_013]|jgi:hypothetical protein|uniref:virulence RhuM family protein n=1 Tax=Thermosynechococcus sp. M3746_W2019_013 TaxID=2747806 RepID=UPI0025E407B0|nr:hypothetical protein [Thermosynechococcus sp. M3746_W2019_013]
MKKPRNDKPFLRAETAPKEPATRGEIVLYRAPDGSIALDVRLEQETVWLTQKQMAQLFQTERSVITKHLRNIFASGELKRESVCAIFAHTAEDGKTYQTQYYNLDAIISVGYRVNSPPWDPVSHLGHTGAARAPGQRLHRQRPSAGGAPPNHPGGGKHD